ncbi:hypothetical protein EW145_g1184 [Phellinidium pouzarii]|uniref:t-SNARE coiled-coil homology domain-containing protein n=1 Tax=Phellinidium pouzarii TaxID=167371 RepID=A0A4S4LFG7_9AGAM|nr:hypothetical protein EW145_g1184 [Phellinidium pouzarii]
MSSSSQPTTRSRTLLFISYRDSTTRPPRRNPFLPAARNYSDDDAYINPDDEHEHLISNGPGPPHLALEVDLPPKWCARPSQHHPVTYPFLAVRRVDISDQVHDALAVTQSKSAFIDRSVLGNRICALAKMNIFMFRVFAVSALEKLHAKHVLPGFSDRSVEEREIETLTSDITRSLIQNIAASSSHAFPPNKAGPSRHEALATQNVQRALAAKVQDLSATFRKKQRVYMETLQGHAIKNQDLLVASGAVSLKGLEGMSDLDEDIRVATHGQQTSMLEEEELGSDLRTRDREITEIAKSIAALADLFKDLSALVIDQGTLLDSVEYNIEATSVHMAEAVTELNIAERYQKNTGRRKCIFLLLLIIFGLIITLIFKPSRHARPPPAPPTSSTEQLPPLPLMSVDVGFVDPTRARRDLHDGGDVKRFLIMRISVIELTLYITFVHATHFSLGFTMRGLDNDVRAPVSFSRDVWTEFN